MTGGRPFGQFLRVVLVFVAHDGVKHVQGDSGFVRGVFESAGGSGLRAGAGAFGRDGGFKVRDVGAEVGEEIGVEAEIDELGGERRDVGLEGAGGIEEGLIAGAAGQEEFAIESGSAEQRE